MVKRKIRKKQEKKEWKNERKHAGVRILKLKLKKISNFSYSYENQITLYDHAISYMQAGQGVKDTYLLIYFRLEKQFSGHLSRVQRYWQESVEKRFVVVCQI